MKISSVSVKAIFLYIMCLVGSLLFILYKMRFGDEFGYSDIMISIIAFIASAITVSSVLFLSNKKY